MGSSMDRRASAHDDCKDSSSSSSAHARPRASSSVCVRPELLKSRIRSRSLLRAPETSGAQVQSTSMAMPHTQHTTHTEEAASTTPSSPRFGATLLPRLAAVFGGGAGVAVSSNSGGEGGNGKHDDAYIYTSASCHSANNTSSPDRVSLSDSASSSMLTFSEDAACSTMPPTPASSIVPDNPFTKMMNGAFASTPATSSSSPSSGSGNKTKSPPAASSPFLPRRRTLSNLFSQITGNGRDKEQTTMGHSNKKDSRDSPSSFYAQLPKKESPPILSNNSRAGPETHMHVPSHGWSTSTSAVPTPPIASSSYSNPFASAFSNQAMAPRPSSPRLKKQQSYLALTIPPTPGASTPSLAYTENGNRPLRGEDEDCMLPSPISEAEEQEHPTHPHHRHHYAAEHSSASHQENPSHASSSLYDGIGAQPVSSSSSFLSSLTSTAPTLSTQRASHQTLSTLLPPILFLCISFVISLTIMFYMVSTIPLKIPHNISEIKLQTVALRDYSRKGLSEGLHVSAVLSALFVFKQAFSVPGSILVNILFGSLYGTYAATLCACIFTGVGSVLAYYMARLCAPLVERFFPRALATTRSALLSGSSSDLFSYLLLARLFPLLPYSALNIACGVLKVPVSPYFITLVLGSFPYNFVTTQLGDLLGNLANSAEAGNINAIWTWDLIFKLAVASILSAAPVIFKEQLKGIIGGADHSTKPDHLRPVSPSRLPREVDSIPLNPLRGEVAESDRPYAFGSYASYGQENGSAPLLRRDRTDSSASEVLYAPALELSSSSSSSSPNKQHKKQWSFSWKNLRRSLNNESASSEYSAVSAGSTSFASHSTARTSLDEEVGDTDEENVRDKMIYHDLQRRSSGSSFHSFASRNSQQVGGHSRPSSIDFSLSKHGRRTASIESASSSPTVAQHNQFVFTPPAAHAGVRSSQDWDRF